MATVPKQYDQRQVQSIIDRYERRIAALERAISSTSYTVSNGVESRTLDVSTATAGDIAEVLGTLIEDMQQRGRLS